MANNFIHRCLDVNIFKFQQSIGSFARLSLRLNCHHIIRVEEFDIYLKLNANTWWIILIIILSNKKVVAEH